MASTLKNGGFVVAPQGRAGNYQAGTLLSYPVSNSYGTNIFPGDPVKIGTTGTLERAAVSTDIVLGVLNGIKPEGQPSFVPTNYFASGTSARSSFSGANQILGLVVPAGSNIFEVQADGSVSAGDIGRSFDVTVGTGGTISNGANIKGYSTARVHASSRSAAAGVVKMMGISTRTGESITDQYPYILVQFNNTIESRVSLA